MCLYMLSSKILLIVQHKLEEKYSEPRLLSGFDEQSVYRYRHILYALETSIPELAASCMLENQEGKVIKKV